MRTRHSTKQILRHELTDFEVVLLSEEHAYHKQRLQEYISGVDTSIHYEDALQLAIRVSALAEQVAREEMRTKLDLRLREDA